MNAQRLTSQTIGALLIVALLALVGAGCGGGSGSSSAGDRSSSKKLPGFKQLGLNDREFAAKVEATESEVARCMSAAGFDYVPVPVQTVELATQAVRAEPGLSRREYKVRWGFGATTRFDNRLKEIALGPNRATLQGLPEADRDAYERTLYGEDPDATFAFTLDEEDFQPTGGCTRQAVDKVFTKEQVSGNYVNPKDALIDDDPRIVAANERYAECMKDAGYDYDDQDVIIEEFEERVDKLVGEQDPSSLPGPQAAKLKALQQEEIKVSLVDLQCQIKHTDKVYEEVEIEILGEKV